MPITIFDNPYFSERLRILNPFHKCINSFDVFCNDLIAINSEKEYFEYYNSVKERIIQDIRNQPSFQSFVNKLIEKDSCNRFQKQNLFSDNNHGKTFVSIDLKQANFTILHMYDPEIFNGCNTWYDYISGYTDFEHIRTSKYIRQVVLGACNPGRQIHFEEIVMKDLAQKLIDRFPTINIYSVNVDEILVEIDHGSDQVTISGIHDFIDKSFLSEKVKVDSFILRKLNGIEGYVKVRIGDPDKEVEFKCINGEIYHQLLLHYMDMPISENDLVFYHDGKLAKFLNPIPNPWVS